MRTDKEKLTEPDNRPTRGEESEELVHYDDAVIGKAFRWSLIAFVALAAIALGTVFFLKRKPAAAQTQVVELSAPQARKVNAAEVPGVRFVNITSQAGIQFSHFNGAYGDKLLPETMGSGAGFFDFDNDNDQDLLFVNSSGWPWHDYPQPAKPTLALYANDGTGKFNDVTAQSGLDTSVYGMGVAFGDYDNDGWVDVFITAVGENRLFRNLGGGRFVDVTADAGVAGGAEEWSTSAAWMDHDNDGDLDLFVCNYVRWSKEIDLEVGYKLVGIGRAYGPPMNFAGTFPYLYRNDGSGKFTDISEESGIQVKNTSTGVPVAKSLGIAPVDVDRDGWIDIIVANDTVQNFLFHNQQNGTFKEVGAISGVGFDSYGMARGAMGIDTGYFRNEADLGIAIANFANEMSALFVSQAGGLQFADEAIPAGIGPASRLLLKFGLFFFDYDLDGRLDLLTANGHLEEEISLVQQSQQFAQPAQLFWNAGPDHPLTYLPVPPERAGADLFTPIVGRGSAFADIDQDGDLDVVFTQSGGAPLLLRNDQTLGNQWLRLKLVGKKANRDAIGAWVRVKQGNRVLLRQVMPARSYLSHSELPITIGLGANQPDSVEVLWPDGKTQPVEQWALNSLTIVEERL